MPCAIATGCGMQVVVVVRTTLRTRLTLRTGAWRAILRAFTFFLALCTFTCAGGWSAICTAPPPIRAPPHVHAHNFAKAIRTDIFPDLFSRWAGNGAPTRRNLAPSIRPPLVCRTQSAIGLTLLKAVLPKKSSISLCKIKKRPDVELFADRLVNSNRSYKDLGSRISTT